MPAAQRYPAGTPFRATDRTIDGTQLRIIDSGTGTPVVLLHGFGASMYSWRHTLPALTAAGYRVIAFDNRGFGFSAKPAHGYRTAEYATLRMTLASAAIARPLTTTTTNARVTSAAVSSGSLRT